MAVEYIRTAGGFHIACYWLFPGFKDIAMLSNESFWLVPGTIDPDC